jgi:hypothetical protein
MIAQNIVGHKSRRSIVCQAGIDVVAELDDRAVQSGKHIGKEAVAKNLRPYLRARSKTVLLTTKIATPSRWPFMS